MAGGRVLIVLIILLVPGATLRAESIVMEPATGKKLYRWDGMHLRSHAEGRKLLKWDGQYISHFSSGKSSSSGMERI